MYPNPHSSSKTSVFFKICLFLRYDEEPYARPEGHLGFVQDGHQVDPYGRALDPYGPEYGEYVNGGPGDYVNGGPADYPYHTDPYQRDPYQTDPYQGDYGGYR